MRGLSLTCLGPLALFQGNLFLLECLEFLVLLVLYSCSNFVNLKPITSILTTNGGAWDMLTYWPTTRSIIEH